MDKTKRLFSQKFLFFHDYVSMITVYHANPIDISLNQKTRLTKSGRPTE